MATISAFNFITLNGFYKGIQEDISWHIHGREENEFAANSMKAGNILVFGRKTYEMMATYWPTPFALENDPEVAAGMNNAEKLVFSKTLTETNWQNCNLATRPLVDEIRHRKENLTRDHTILGSGSLVTQLAEAGLIDRYLIMVDPVVSGQGTTLFSGLSETIKLTLKEITRFKSGVVLLEYNP